MKAVQKMGINTLALFLAGAVIGCGGRSHPPRESQPPVLSLAQKCEALTRSTPSDTTFTVVEHRQAGDFKDPLGITSASLPAFCRVAATLKPTSDSNIKVEIWLPADGWNGRYVGLGNGGFAGTLDYPALASGLKRGYAVAHTDMGTSTDNPAGSGQGLIGHPERIIDWGHRSTHLMTAVAKDLVRHYYGQPKFSSYFTGCSTGGGQGLHEAQRYPTDYDGILVGAPANDRVATHTSLMWSGAAARTSPDVALPLQKLQILNKAVVAACDSADGVTDGLVSQPAQCKFDPQVLQCRAGDGDDCLTAGQLSAVQKLYQGPVDSRSGASIYAGQAKGSELGWVAFTYPIAPNGQVLFDDLFYWVFGPSFNWRNFDYGGDFTATQNVLSANVDAASSDLRAFKNRGGKILMYQGLADQLITPGQIVRYLNKVESGTGQTPSFMRLVNVPGMAHCAGGDAPAVFGQGFSLSAKPGDPSQDIFAALERWVEAGEAPEQIVASQFANNDIAAANLVRTRPLCVYPKVARYKGTGDVNSAASFSCEASL